MFNFGHHGHHGQNQTAHLRTGAGAGGVHQPTFKILSRAEENYCLTVRDGNVVLAPANPRDEHQHWYKDMRFSTQIKDEEGNPAFALVNKATGLAIKHSLGQGHPAEEPKPQARPAATTAAPTASASRLAHPHFLVLCLVVGALLYAEQLVTAAGELHVHPALVACIVLAVAGLFHWAVLSLNFLVARRQAAEEPKPQPRPAATTAAPTAPASRPAHPHFLVLCLVVGALPYAEQLVTVAGELHLHPAMVACIVLAVAGLFHWAVLSLKFLVARRQAAEEPKPQPRPAATTAAPTASASRLARPHFLVLCLVVGALPYAEQLVTAAGELHLHPAMVAYIVLAIAGLFDWAVLSLNFLIAPRQAEELKPQPRPATV